MKKYFIAIGVIFKYSKKEAIIIIITSILFGAVLPLQTFLLEHIIASVKSNESISLFIKYLFLYIFIYLFYLLQSYVQETSKMLLRNKLSENFELDILNHINQFLYGCFEDKGTHDLINRFSDPAFLAADTFYSILAFPQQVITLFGLGILFFSVSPMFLLLIFSLFAISLLFNLKEIKRLRKLQIDHSITERKTNYLTQWEKPVIVNPDCLEFGELLKAAIAEARKYKSDRNLSMKVELDTAHLIF